MLRAKKLKSANISRSYSKNKSGFLFFGTRCIYHSVVIAKLCYASSASEGFANATDLNKIQSFINKSKRAGYYSSELSDFENLCTSKKGDLFNEVLNIPTHVLHPLLPVYPGLGQAPNILAFTPGGLLLS